MLLRPPECLGRPLPIQTELPHLSFVSKLRIFSRGGAAWWCWWLSWSLSPSGERTFRLVGSRSAPETGGSGLPRDSAHWAAHHVQCSQRGKPRALSRWSSRPNKADLIWEGDGRREKLSPFPFFSCLFVFQRSFPPKLSVHVALKVQ